MPLLPIITLIQQLSLDVKETPFNPYLGKGVSTGSKSYLITISFETRSMTVYRTEKPGAERPSLADVFDSLLDDVRAYLAHGDDPVNFMQTWDYRFDKRALEDRATRFATLLGGDWFGCLIEEISK